MSDMKVISEQELYRVTGGRKEPTSITSEYNKPIELGNGAVGCYYCSTAEVPVVLTYLGQESLTINGSRTQGYLFQCPACSKKFFKKYDTNLWYLVVD